MDKESRIKELKKELLELEGREVKDETKRLNNKMASGFIMFCVGAIAITKGVVESMTSIVIMGSVATLVGIYQMITGKWALSDFEQEKRDKEEKIIIVKKALLELVVDDKMRFNEEDGQANQNLHHTTVADELLKLASLLSNQAISKEEYDHLKAKLID